MTTEKLVDETIESLVEFLPKVIEVCPYIADKLRSEQDNEALDKITQFVEAVEWCIQAINGLVKLEVKLSINTIEINEYLVEVQNGLEINDFVLVADMFEYEIHPKLLKWFEELSDFKGV